MFSQLPPLITHRKRYIAKFKYKKTKFVVVANSTLYLFLNAYLNETTTRTHIKK